MLYLCNFFLFSGPKLNRAAAYQNQVSLVKNNRFKNITRIRNFETLSAKNILEIFGTEYIRLFYFVCVHSLYYIGIIMCIYQSMLF